jgi:hypothetical protein
VRVQQACSVNAIARGSGHARSRPWRRRPCREEDVDGRVKPGHDEGEGAVGRQPNAPTSKTSPS